MVGQRPPGDEDDRRAGRGWQRVLHDGEAFGTQREQSTVTGLAPGSAFAWESTGALGLARHRFSLAGDGGSTTLTKSAEIVEPTFLAKLSSWKLSRDIPKGLHRDLANIKARLEGHSAGAS